MAYTSPTWVNGNSPALNAANLQALTNQVEANQVLYGTIDPTSATQGNLGQHYCNTTTNAVFICTKATSPYAWQEITGALRAEEGSYTGTGRYGSANPNTLTFSFAPKLVIVQPSGGGAYGPMFVRDSATATAVNYHETSQASTIIWSNGGKTLSWYTQSNMVDFQLNKNNYEYIYIAIG